MRDPWESDQPARQPEPEQTMTESSQSSVARVTQQTIKTMKPQRETKPALGPSALESKKTTATEGLLQFNQANYIQGIIWAEILGKPKAKQRRR